jgi:hypothetical protein
MDLQTIVVNVKVAHIRPRFANLRDWMADPANVYIGRGGVVFIDNKRFPSRDSKWANPYKITRDISRGEVLQLYREYIISKIQRENLYAELRGLRGKNLGCWCAPEQCHGNILRELIAEL